jgi:AraC family transcriptional regulator
MSILTIPAGTYAVFKHKGIASDFFRTSQEIFGTWLPNSNYILEDRPHFEIMDNNYKGPNDSESEEDVYIPIRSKQ